MSRNRFFVFVHKLTGVSLFLLLALTGSAFAQDNELSGVAIQKNGSGASLLIDANKTPGARVEKQKNGTVVIHLPKTKLPKAYQDYGLPQLNSQETGLSATVQKQGDGLTITVPKGAASSLQVKFKSGGSTTVSAAKSTTVTKTTPSKAISQKTLVKPVLKAATRPNVAKPKKVLPKVVKKVVKPVVAAKIPVKPTVVKKPIVQAKAKVETPKAPESLASVTKAAEKTSTSLKSALALPVSLKSVPNPQNTQPETESVGLKATEAGTIEKSAPAIDTSSVGQVETQQTPEATAVSPQLSSETQPEKPLDDSSNALPLAPQETLADMDLPSWLEPVKDLLTPDMLQWLFPLLAIVGAGFIVVAFLLILVRRVAASKTQKAPKKVKTQHSALDFSEADFDSVGVLDSAQPLYVQSQKPPVGQSQFADFLTPEQAQLSQRMPSEESFSAPLSQSEAFLGNNEGGLSQVSATSSRPSGPASSLDERFIRLAQRQPRRR